MATSSTVQVSLPMPTIPRSRRSPAEIAAAAPVSGERHVLLAA
ncbi:MAG: 4-hydroxy-3-methylbut-2-enyl diphosphate reductase, partial [Paeniglutamicibacter sp.]